MIGQKSAVLNHLEKHGGITSMEAFGSYGITRLAAVVHELRRMGYDIVTQECIGKTRFETPCKYARYVFGPNQLKKENE